MLFYLKSTPHFGRASSSSEANTNSQKLFPFIKIVEIHYHLKSINNSFYWDTSTKCCSKIISVKMLILLSSESIAGRVTNNEDRDQIADQGPVFQSIVGLMSPLRDQLVKCFTTLFPNSLIFFVEKMREAFALQKLHTFFPQKILVYLRY